MIYANCEIYENDKGEIGVLTRTNEGHEIKSFLVNDKDPNDVSINFDRRLIEFFLKDPERQHTYREWDKLLYNCGYDVSIFKKDFYAVNNPEDPDYDEQMEHYDDAVNGFKITYVPKGMLVRIGSKSVYGTYNNYDGEKQVVFAYSKEDFIET